MALEQSHRSFLPSGIYERYFCISVRGGRFIIDDETEPAHGFCTPKAELFVRILVHIQLPTPLKKLGLLAGIENQPMSIIVLHTVRTVPQYSVQHYCMVCCTLVVKNDSTRHR